MPASTHRRSRRKPRAATITTQRQVLAFALDHTGALAANAYGDARQLALALHADGHEQTSRAEYLLTALALFAGQVHRAAELAATLAESEAGR